MFRSTQDHVKGSRRFLAVPVTAAMLAACLLVAALLSRARNRPITLGTPVRIEGAHIELKPPAGWERLDLAGIDEIEGFIPAAWTEPGRESTGLLMIITASVSDRYVPAAYAALGVATMLDKTRTVCGVGRWRIEGIRPAGTVQGLPAALITGAFTKPSSRQQFAMLTVCNPEGRAIAVLLLTDLGRLKLATDAVLNIGASLKFPLRLDPAEQSLRRIGITVASSAATSDLRAFVHDVPLAGAIMVTLLPDGDGKAGRDWSLSVWTGWLASGRTPRDLAAAYCRRQTFEAAAPRAVSKRRFAEREIWIATILDEQVAGLRLTKRLFVTASADRKVLWGLLTATGKTEAAERRAVELLAGATVTTELPDYESAVSAAREIYSVLTSGGLEDFFKVNQGKRWLIYRDAAEGPKGFFFRTAGRADSNLTAAESGRIYVDGRSARYSSAGWIAADMSAFEFEESIRRATGETVRMKYARKGPAVAVSLQFGPKKPTKAIFRLAEPFLPDLAQDAASLLVAHKPGAVAMFRIAGMTPESPESLRLRSLGEKRLRFAGRDVSAWACEMRQDTADSVTVVLFDQNGKVLGYIWPDGTLEVTTEEQVKKYFGGQSR